MTPHAVTQQRLPEDRCSAPRGWTLYQCAHGSRAWIALRCRRCPACLAAKRAKILLRLYAGASSVPDAAMLTLTSLPDTPWPVIMRAWSSMARYLRRTSPQLQYAAIKEEGSRTGMRHLHVLLIHFRYRPQRLLSAEWSRLTGAHQVDIRRVAGSLAARYVAKYLSKSDPGARKRATFSKQWPKLPPLQQTLQAIAKTGPLGPSSFVGVASNGALLAMLAPNCPCWGAPRPPSLGDRLWLKSLQDRSPPVSPAD